jgi:hypothetical protein
MGNRDRHLVIQALLFGLRVLDLGCPMPKLLIATVRAPRILPKKVGRFPYPRVPCFVNFPRLVGYRKTWAELCKSFTNLFGDGVTLGLYGNDHAPIYRGIFPVCKLDGSINYVRSCGDFADGIFPIGLRY